MAKKSKAGIVTAAGKELQLKWNVDKSITTHHATNLVVQVNVNGIFLSFFEAVPPILVGTPEQVAARLKGLDTLEANCVSRIVVSPMKFVEFVDILNKSAQQLVAQAKGSEAVQ